MVTARSKQVAITPEVDPPAPKGQDPEDIGVYSIADAVGDDFPIQFDADIKQCIQLPGHPYTQQPINKPLNLAPGQSQIVIVGIRPWGQCGSGSCSETQLEAQGTFSNGDPAVGCAGSALWVDTTLPTENWGFEVNDCDGNGTYDADQIFFGSADLNENGIPDECESGCPWDCIGNDGVIGIEEFLAILGGWGPSGASLCDFDGDGQIGIEEFLKVLGVWGPCP